jgi:hypothetical protein
MTQPHCEPFSPSSVIARFAKANRGNHILYYPHSLSLTKNQKHKLKTYLIPATKE